MAERKNYLDNIRWITVCIVIVYHIIYIFNCSDVITNIPIQSDYPVLDSFLVFVYPWFMCLLFAVSGISSRLALSKRTDKEFIKERTSKILVPSICGAFIYGWLSGLITNQYNDMFNESSGEKVPAAVKYLVYSLMGIGPLWFAHVLFIASVLLLIVRKLDKNDKLWNICGKTNYLVLFLLTAAVWGSSFLLNAPMITVYRFGIYFLMFFLGYFVFSHDEVIDKLKKIAVPMGILTVAVGMVYTVFYYGRNYADSAVLTGAFTNIYLWIAVLAILGLGAKFLNFSNRFTVYMNKNNFAFYVLHYTVVLVIAYLSTTYLKPSIFAVNYLLMLLGAVTVLPLLTEIVKRIPILRKLVLGISKKK